MITIKSILTEMRESVEKGDIKAPDWWLSHAVHLTALWQSLKDEKVKAEIEFIRVVNEFGANGESDTRATKLAKAKLPAEGKDMNEYQWFQYLEGRDKILKEFLMLAKKYSNIDSYGLH